MALWTRIQLILLYIILVQIFSAFSFLKQKKKLFMQLIYPVIEIIKIKTNNIFILNFLLDPKINLNNEKRTITTDIMLSNNTSIFI